MTDESTRSGVVTTVMSVVAGLGLVGGAGVGGFQWSDAQIESEREAHRMLIDERVAMRGAHTEAIDKLTADCDKDVAEIRSRYDAVVMQCTEAGLLGGGTLGETP